MLRTLDDKIFLTGDEIRYLRNLLRSKSKNLSKELKNEKIPDDEYNRLADQQEDVVWPLERKLHEFMKRNGLCDS